MKKLAYKVIGKRMRGRSQTILGRKEGSNMTGHSKIITPEQILDAAKDEGYELSDEELEGVAGGGEWRNECCPGADTRALYTAQALAYQNAANAASRGSNLKQGKTS